MVVMSEERIALCRWVVHGNYLYVSSAYIAGGNGCEMDFISGLWMMDDLLGMAENFV